MRPLPVLLAYPLHLPRYRTGVKRFLHRLPLLLAFPWSLSTTSVRLARMNGGIPNAKVPTWSAWPNLESAPRTAITMHVTPHSAQHVAPRQVPNIVLITYDRKVLRESQI